MFYIRLQRPFVTAERLMLKHGCCWS